MAMAADSFTLNIVNTDVPNISKSTNRPKIRGNKGAPKYKRAKQKCYYPSKESSKPTLKIGKGVDIAGEFQNGVSGDVENTNPTNPNDGYHTGERYNVKQNSVAKFRPRDSENVQQGETSQKGNQKHHAKPRISDRPQPQINAENLREVLDMAKGVKVNNLDVDQIGVTNSHAASKAVDQHEMATDKMARKRNVQDFEEVKPEGDVEMDSNLVIDDETSKEIADGFGSLGIWLSLAKHLHIRMELKKPTPIQRAAIPVLRTGKDTLIRSETGSGKTLSYLIPVANSFLITKKKVDRDQGTLAVILVPTRELCAQVEDTAKKLLRPYHWIVVGSVMGGEKKKSEKARLRKGINLMICTPGRFLDHMLTTTAFKWENCKWLIMDEADRLLDMGFEKNIQEILRLMKEKLKQQVQHILVSATLTDDVLRLASISLENPKKVSVGISFEAAEGAQQTTEGFSVPVGLRQHYSIVPQKHRLVSLIAFLRLRCLKDAHCKAIVFFSTCDSVDFHYALFQSVSLPREFQQNDEDEEDERTFRSLFPVKVHKMHGLMQQTDRLNTFKIFRNASSGILLCTDVAARGLDMDKLNFSVQYDPPTRDEQIEYLHRAGRTARIGGSGDALLFLLPSETEYQKTLFSRGYDMKQLSHDAALALLLSPGRRKNDDLVYCSRLSTSILQDKIQSAVEEDEELKSMASEAYRGYLRAYSTHSRDNKHIFHLGHLHLGHAAAAHGLKEKPASVNTKVHESVSFKRKRELAEKETKRDNNLRFKLQETARMEFEE